MRERERKREFERLRDGMSERSEGEKGKKKGRAKAPFLKIVALSVIFWSLGFLSFFGSQLKILEVRKLSEICLAGDFCFFGFFV